MLNDRQVMDAVDRQSYSPRAPEGYARGCTFHMQGFSRSYAITMYWTFERNVDL